MRMELNDKAAVLEKIKKSPDVEEELNTYLDAVRKQQELHLSIHALKALEKYYNYERY